MATSPESFFELFSNIKKKDGIVASRYINGSIVNPPQNVTRVIASRIFNFIIRALFLLPYRDTQCGAKLFKRGPIEMVMPKISSMRWVFDVDLLYQMKREGYNIIEFPTFWSDKEYSKVNFKSAGPSMILALFRLRILNSKFEKIIKLFEKIKERK